MELLKHIKKNKSICIILAVFFVFKFIFLAGYTIVWWDSSVYIGMGKYIYSYGSSGIWEGSRPIIWPLMLGFLWKTGMDPAFHGRILEFVFGGACILLTYLIGKKIFDRKTALLASLFLALSPTFFFFNGIMLTETVSTAFSLLAIYFLTEKRNFMSGLFFGIAFLSRFLQLFVFVAAALTAFVLYRNYFGNFKKMSLGFVAAVIPYLIINQAIYLNPIHPFIAQFFLAMNSGWDNYHHLDFYFIELFKENFLYLLSFSGIFLAFLSKSSHKKMIASIFMALFVFFNSISQKEMRFLIILMPYMYLLVSFSVFNFYNKLRSDGARMLPALIIVLPLIISVAAIPQYYEAESNKKNEYSAFQSELDSASGAIWISSPVIAAFSDSRISKLMYYPFFNSENKNEMAAQIKDADFVFLDSCDLACRPSDSECENSRKDMIFNLKKQMQTTYSSKNRECEQYIFRAIS